MILIVLPDITAEQTLLAQARQNDQDALRQIYERYFPPIYQFIRLRVNEREQAQDIASEVFLDFFVALRGARPPQTSLRAWLFRVARNKIYDHYGRHKQFPLETLADWLPDTPESSPEVEFVRALDVERARRALTLLNAEQQEVLILRFGQALNLQETADIMGTSISAVKSLQFRAVNKLRQILERMGGVL
ncbi:MAG: sigma-70 family RNA polymerase sigma factor [Chloroflexi bacterium]|nr:sigma-70 family RNA polymerase sigma factor [Chloroflexota bacterium]